jgi:protein-tyrosine phosphatase
VTFIDEQRRAGLPVYVHCQAGASRSALVVTAYVMQREGWGRDETLAWIRKRRPVVRPNLVFMPLLLEWEKTVASRSREQPAQ